MFLNVYKVNNKSVSIGLFVPMFTRTTLVKKIVIQKPAVHKGIKTLSCKPNKKWGIKISPMYPRREIQEMFTIL